MATDIPAPTLRSTGVYAPDKALAEPGRSRLNVLRSGGQPYPVHLHLILSDLCNLDCPGCAYRLSGYSSNELFKVIEPDGTVNRNPNRMLEVPLVLRVLDDCAAMGTKAVEFTGGGEPLVHPKAGLLIAYAQQLGLDTALITNGLLLPVRVPMLVLTQLVWLRLSIDAATPATFDAVRPGLGHTTGTTNFARVLDALSWARGACDALHSKCVIGAGFVVQKENYRELYDAVRIYRESGAHNVRISGLFTPEKDRYFDGWREEAEELERRAVADFDEGPGGFRVHGRFREKVADLQAAPEYQHCGYEHFTTYLGADANLYRCCVTSYNPQGLIGNVREAGGLRALWESDQKRARFEGFDARTCTQCQFNDRNRAINAALAAPELPPAPEDVVHASFV